MHTYQKLTLFCLYLGIKFNWMRFDKSISDTIQSHKWISYVRTFDMFESVLIWNKMRKRANKDDAISKEKKIFSKSHA